MDYAVVEGILYTCDHTPRHLLGGGSAMTDSERDEIDSEAQKFIERSRDRINSLRDHCMWYTVAI